LPYRSRNVGSTDFDEMHAENSEYDLRHSVIPEKAGVVRVLAFTNCANMGIYRDAVARIEKGLVPARRKNRPIATRPEVWCERGDSNPHGFTRQILSLVRLPIPPLSLKF
jgi:hypothetical protein